MASFAASANNLLSLIVYGMRWSTSCAWHPNRLGYCYTFLQKRILAVVDKIAECEREGKTYAVVDFKKFVKDGWRSWWKDTRGINDLESVDVLILIGVPCRSLADLEAEFTVLHGRAPVEGTREVKYLVQVTGKGTADLDPCFDMDTSADREFSEFVRSRVLADFHQGIGRLRAHRRPDQNLEVCVLADYPLDVPVHLVKASQITPEAGTKIERVEMAIQGAVAELKATGQKVTQTAIAKLAGLTQGYISRFRKLLQTLLESSNSVCNNFGQPPPDPNESQWMAAEYLPLLANSPPKELLEGVLSAFEAYGGANFKAIWDATPAAAQIILLQNLLLTQSSNELRALGSILEVSF